MDEAAVHRKPCRTTQQNYESSFLPKQNPQMCISPTIIEASKETTPNVGETSREKVKVRHFAAGPETEEILHNPPEYIRNSLALRHVKEDALERASHNEDYPKGHIPMFSYNKSYNFENSEHFETATSLNINEKESHDLNLTPFQRHSFHERTLSSSASMNDPTTRPLMKLLHVLKPAPAYQFKRNLSLRFSLSGQKPNRHCRSFDSAHRHECCAKHYSKHFRHTWSGTKSRKWTLRKLSCYHAVNSSSGSSGGNETRSVYDTPSKLLDSSTFADTDSFVKSDGTELLVKVDVHRTVTGEATVCECENPVQRPKERRHECGEDPFAIRTDVRGSFRKMTPRPPAAFDNNYQSRYSAYEHSSEYNGSICTFWLRAIDNMTRPCPGCSQYIGPALITIFVLSVLCCVVALIVFFTWIIGDGFLGW